MEVIEKKFKALFGFFNGENLDFVSIWATQNHLLQDDDHDDSGGGGDDDDEEVQGAGGKAEAQTEEGALELVSCIYLHILSQTGDRIDKLQDYATNPLCPPLSPSMSEA